jgi:predicted Rossmann fold nucleotide-binding protein DprA/Smf involved in DNA uptake
MRQGTEREGGYTINQERMRKGIMMKQLKKDVRAVVRDLKRLTQMTDKIVKQLEKLDKAQALKKPKAKARKKVVGKKAKKTNPSDTVLAIIKRRKKGIDVATLEKRTGFKKNNLRAIIFRLRKKGEIKSEGKGLYVKT